MILKIIKFETYFPPTYSLEFIYIVEIDDFIILINLSMKLITMVICILISLANIVSANDDFNAIFRLLKKPMKGDKRRYLSGEN